MKKLIKGILLMMVMVLVLAAAAVGIKAYRYFVPSREKADLNDWFHVSGNEVAIILDQQLEEEARGMVQDGQIYLPLSWVNSRLNDRFYWSKEDHQLMYALPESIVYADAQTMGENGHPLLLDREDGVWLMLELIQSYTDVRILRFAEEEGKRVFIDTLWEPVPSAKLKKAGAVRVKGGVKSEILVQAEKGEEVIILETLESWVKVRTASGYIGYVPKRILGEEGSQQYISVFQEPLYKNRAMDEPIRMVWHQVTTKAANAGVEALLSGAKGLNVIAPTWFMLTDNEGNYESFADKSYVDFVHRKGIQVWAVLDNFNKGENVRSEVLFASTKARETLISSLMEEVQRCGIDGINLDIEHIKPEAGPHYVQFIRELSIACRKKGIFLSVDSYVPSAYTAFYNREEQGKVADYVVIMGYDEHYAGSDAGSVASLGYEQKGIENTLKMVPANKIISGIPFYTRLWKLEDGKTTSKAMGISAAKQWIQENQADLVWLEELGQYYGEKYEGNAIYQMWLEEERSIELKMGLVKRYGLAGAAFWRLGFETPEVWEIVQP